MKSATLKIHTSASRLALMLGMLLLISCSGNNNQTETEHEEEEHSDALSLTEKQMQAVGITIGKMEFKNLKSVVKANGLLEVPPQSKAEVHPLIGGLIRRIHVLEGSYVRKGQTLVTLENPEFIQVQQDYLASKSALSFAEKEYARQKELMAAKAGTGKVYQQAEANYFSEQARFRTLQSQLKQMGISVSRLDRGDVITQLAVSAPISGVVGHIMATTGSFAEISNPLMNITDNSSIHCDLLVYEKDLFNVKTGQQVDFVLTNQGNQKITGKIYGINKSFENDSKAVIAHARIDNSANKNLIPGMYVSALINVGNQATRAVPLDAVVSAQGKSFIFVVDNVQNKEVREEHTEDPKEERAHEHENKVHFRPLEVVTGVSDLGYMEIKLLNAIAEETAIVTKGAFYLQSKAAGGGGEHQH
ncbi:cobalt-zinc-cadmium efflux system membrane fusion protein [Arcticibacter pallidicorallinus]|uniref:Cobalt-zinc-cadmium efflux system membrane fusion protein n=1 Tax=Arcticibacter pallidicorallinus TaxID=1259464 RepID=A0A2T0U3L5_9SPHI|nr:efflux RND transporter periplasmic adaptor subunit [Arcticibacter pallidicorallinus]PRY52458.1 cobalt-zinc-cadmium efflux system membrane fusion protein [Arcticibacter pallidicorallinus]